MYSAAPAMANIYFTPTEYIVHEYIHMYRQIKTFVYVNIVYAVTQLVAAGFVQLKENCNKLNFLFRRVNILF